MTDFAFHLLAGGAVCHALFGDGPAWARDRERLWELCAALRGGATRGYVFYVRRDPESPVGMSYVWVYPSGGSACTPT